MNRMKRTLKRGISRKLGTIKWGMKHPQKGYPMALDYFVLSSDDRVIQSAFAECYGARPDNIVVRIQSPDDVTHTENLFDGNRTFARTNGESLEFYDRDKNGNRRTTIYDPAKIDEMGGMERAKIVIKEHIIKKGRSTPKRLNWSETLHIRFHIVWVNWAETGGDLGAMQMVDVGILPFGCFELYTKSEYSIDPIVALVDDVGENIKNAPLVLNVKKHKGEGREYPLVSLFPIFKPQEGTKLIG